MWKKWLLGILALLVVAVSVLLYKMDALMQVRLQEAINDAAGPEHQVTIGAFESSILSGDAELRDVRIQFDSTRIGITELPFTLDISAVKIRLEGLGYWALFMHRSIHVSKVLLAETRVEYRYFTKRAEENAHTGPKDDAAITTGFLVIGQLDLENASGLMQRYGTDSADFTCNGLDVHLTGISVVRLPDANVHWNVVEADVAMRTVSAALPPLYDARMDSLTISYPEGNILLSGIRLEPRAVRDRYASLVDDPTELFDLDLRSIHMVGADLGVLLRDRAVHVRSVSAKGDHLTLDHDGRMTGRKLRYRTLPCTGLSQLRLDLQVDSMQLQLDHFRYGDHGPKARGFGDISVEGVTANLYQVRSGDHTQRADTLRVELTGALYGKGKVKADFVSPYQAKNDHFDLSIQVGKMPLVHFAELTEDLLHAAPTSGDLSAMSMKMTGDEDRAYLDLDMRYTGLKLEVWKKEGKRGKLLTTVANVAIFDDNPTNGKPPRKPSFSFERRKERSIAAYIVDGLKEGLVRSLLNEKFADKAMKKVAKKK